MIRILVRTFLWLLIVMLLPTAAAAAQLITFDQAMRAITVLEWSVIFVLSTLTGALTLTMRFSAYVNSFPVDQAVPPMRGTWALVTSNMLGSWVAGLLGFFLASMQGAAGMSIAVLVLLASFGGAKTLEFFYERAIGKRQVVT
jgi:hypothetical protein